MCFLSKQETAYEMRFIDWSADVCSSDLSLGAVFRWSRRDAAPFVAHRINPTLQARRYRLPITMAWTLITTGIKQFMAKEELLEMQGSVTEVLPDSHFRVTLENGHPGPAYPGDRKSVV